MNEANDTSLEPTHKSLSIIVAEDNEINSFLIRGFLQKHGFGSDSVKDGAALLACLESAHYDVIFMDVHMPKVDGIMATQQIRSRPMLGGQPYIIAVTASALLEDKEACLKAGMNDFLTKPITVDALIRCLNRMRRPERLRIEEMQQVFDSFEGDDEIFGELSQIFHEQKPGLESAMEAALAEADFKRLAELSHTLKGSLCSFTSTLATPWAIALETAARKADLETSRVSYSQLRTEIKQLTKLIDQRLEARGQTILNMPHRLDETKNI